MPDPTYEELRASEFRESAEHCVSAKVDEVGPALVFAVLSLGAEVAALRETIVKLELNR